MINLELENITDKLKDRMTALTAAIVLGVLLINIGIFLMETETHSYIGSRTLIVGSAIFYLLLLVLVFTID